MGLKRMLIYQCSSRSWPIAADKLILRWGRLGNGWNGWGMWGGTRLDSARLVCCCPVSRHDLPYSTQVENINQYPQYHQYNQYPQFRQYSQYLILQTLSNHRNCQDRLNLTKFNNRLLCSLIMIMRIFYWRNRSLGQEVEQVASSRSLHQLTIHYTAHRS